MNYFEDWNKDIHNVKYFDLFLSEESNLNEIYNIDSSDTQRIVIDTLLKADINEIIARIIENNEYKDILPCHVPQFSSFEMGTKRLCEYLDFYPEGLSYKELGSMLCKAPSDGACVKYGENHAKLAHSLQLVQILGEKGVKVVISPFGKEIIKISDGKEIDIYKKLFLRERIVKDIIIQGNKGKVAYRNVVSVLSEATAIRRRTNTKCILQLALKGSSFEYIYDNVIW